MHQNNTKQRGEQTERSGKDQIVTQMVIFSGAMMPISAGESLSATRKPIRAAIATGARLLGE